MRWFSRVGAWLRGNNPDLGAHVEPADIDGHRFPAAPPAVFVRRLLDAVRSSSEGGGAVLETLDPAVLVLVLPGGGKPGESLSDQVDAALTSVEHHGRALQSLTWSALREARPPFQPSYQTWAGELAPAFEGDAGLVFFVDVYAIARTIGLAAQGLGFSTRMPTQGSVVVVSDGRYQARISINAVIAEALWSARGPLAVITRRVRALPADFRSYLAVHSALRRRHPQALVDVDGDALRIQRADHDVRVDYRHIAAAAKSAGLSVDAWLDRATVDDIAIGGGEPAMLLRAPGFLRAYPDALHEAQAGAALVAVRLDEDGRADTVRRRDGDPGDRLEHFRAESRRQLSFLRFEADGFVREESGFPVVGLVGDRVASIALAPELVRGVVEHLFPAPSVLRVVATAEDCVLLTLPDCPPDVVARATDALHRLEGDLVEDRSDRLTYDATLELPTEPAGSFALRLVDDSYFDYATEADRALAHAGDRGELYRGLALLTIGQHEKAVTWFEKAVRAHQDDGEANLALGQALSMAKKHARAVPFLARAVELLPESAEAQNALGLALYIDGDLMRARDAFESAVRLEPMDATFLTNLGRSYADTHLFFKARACLERALRLDPSSAEAHASMALVCHRTGDPVGARRHAREALAEDPDDATVKKLLEVLEEEPGSTAG